MHQKIILLLALIALSQTALLRNASPTPTRMAHRRMPRVGGY